MDWFLNELAIFARPALFNIYFAGLSLPIGFGLAVFLALGKGARNALIRNLCNAYIYAFRGSPLFIQFFMFYTLALSLNVPLWKPLGVSGVVLHPLFLGPFVIVLNTTAYTAQILHGALATVPRGQIEAARAYGMSRSRAFRSVIWPNLIRVAWPAYTNEVVFVFHATAVVYLALPVIGDQKDLMVTAKDLFERDYNAFLHFSVAALYFLVISLLIFFVFERIYKRMMRHLHVPAKVRFTANILR